MERSGNGNGPRKLCFGNFDLRKGKCKPCPLKVECSDDQAGFRFGTITANSERMMHMEELVGLPDWVFEWDELSEEELAKLQVEEPERAKIFNLLNSGIQD